MNLCRLICSCILIFTYCHTMSAQAQEQTATTDRIAAATKKLAGKQKYELIYKLRAGEKIRWKVEHVATTKAQIAGTSETTSSRTQSIKLWTVTGVDNAGNMTFDHSVESTSLWQKIGDQEPVSFDSNVDKQAPEQFAGTSEMIGRTLAEVTISAKGKIVDRESDFEQMKFGVGDLCIPLPDKAISVGHRWYVPTIFDAVDQDGKRLKLKARINYQLSKVADGKAIITFRSEVLTPIENDQIRSQLLQKLNDGYVAFDMNRGRIVAKEVLWNEKVQEYAGADSFLQYIGRMNEELMVGNPIQPQPRVSEKNSDKSVDRQ